MYLDVGLVYSFLGLLTMQGYKEHLIGNPQSINIGEFLLINALFSIDKINSQKKCKNEKKICKTKKKKQKKNIKMLVVG